MDIPYPLCQNWSATSYIGVSARDCNLTAIRGETRENQLSASSQRGVGSKTILQSCKEMVAWKFSPEEQYDPGGQGGGGGGG